MKKRLRKKLAKKKLDAEAEAVRRVIRDLWEMTAWPGIPHLTGVPR